MTRLGAAPGAAPRQAPLAAVVGGAVVHELARPSYVASLLDQTPGAAH